MQRTPDTVRSIDDCTTAFKPRCLVQSSSENDKNRPLRQLSNKPPFAEHLPGYDETPTNAAHCLPCHAFTASACACAAYPSSRLPKVSA
ncbi:hypothetical protein IV536_003733, partial [Escherichia coli]